jgi:hypothetical protein
MSNLISLATLANEIHETLLANGGDLTPELELKLMEIESKLPNKADGYAYVCEDLSHKIDMLKSRAKSYAHAAQSLDRHIDYMKSKMRDVLTMMDTKEIKGIEYKWKLQNAKDKVIIENEALIPDQYMEVTITRTPIKELLYAELKTGREVPGCRLESSTYVKSYINTK